MKNDAIKFEIEKIGKCKIPSPMTRVKFISDDKHVIYKPNLKLIKTYLDANMEVPVFEMAGPREKIYFDPSKLKCGIVSCGGLCPGLNDVIRAVVFSLHHHYKVKSIFGFKYGFEGLSYKYQHSPIELTPEYVSDIHLKGGTILSSSRGEQDSGDIVDTLEQMNINLLFVIGGDGTLRGGRDIAEEIKKRKLKISVIGIPKTIDNDISYVQRSFGFETAVSESKVAIYSAHVEARGARNGVGLVKLMGRHSGFIAANATLATSDVNYCLIPEVDFTLDGFLKSLKQRLERRHHAVIVVGEGAGQKLIKATNSTDRSGNTKLSDIGVFLRDEIKKFFYECAIEVNMKYIDPSYMLRSVPANPNDSVLCLLLGHNAVHAGMTGRTNMVVGLWNNEFTHLPIPLAVSKRKKIDINGTLWNSVLASTGQPSKM